MRRHLCAFLLVAASGGCDGSPDSLRVRVEYPAGYGETVAPGVELVLEEPGQEPRVARTDSAGLASFSVAPLGAFVLRAVRELSAEESAALTGHSTAVRLTATATMRTASEGLTVLRLSGPRLGGWVIKELSYTGAPGLNGAHYFHDQFIELYNNSTEALEADGLCVADAFGPAGEINAGTAPTPFRDDPDHVVVDSVWCIPGAGGEHVVPPGGSVVIAQDGSNHQPDSTVDLSDADWETFNARDDERDVDWPTVPNLTRVHFNGVFDWLLPVFGPAVIVFRVDDPTALEGVPVPRLPGERRRVPTSAVLDGVEALMNADSVRYRRLPDAVDRGFVFASGTYSGESARRRVAATVAGRRVLADTGDSARDFQLVARPSPREF